jgi:hypothetical protein
MPLQSCSIAPERVPLAARDADAQRVFPLSYTDVMPSFALEHGLFIAPYHDIDESPAG